MPALEWPKVIRPRDKGDVPDDPLSRMRHSASHVMADAVRRLRPNAKVAIGPSIDNGFYYDFDTEPFAPEDAARIEAEMAKIIAENLPVRAPGGLARRGARTLFESRGETYKVEIIQSIPEGDEVSLLPARRLHRPLPRARTSSGPATSRPSRCCRSRAPTGAATSATPSSSASTAPPCRRRRSWTSTWRASRRPSAATTATLGKELDLYSFDDLVGPGFVLWHPKGAFVRYQIEEIIRRENVRRGYELVYTPHVAREQLLETSGHLAHYKENLFGGMELDGQRYLVKPMNCPFHVAIYRSQMRSYRDLPLRYSELGTVYRYERSGVLHGLLRVRGLTQDDAHLFVREEQIADEFMACVRFCARDAGAVRLRRLQPLPRHPPGELHGRARGLGQGRGGAAHACSRASGGRTRSTRAAGRSTGPRSISRSRTRSGREWQCSTFQLDFQLPERFELEYVAQDGSRQRPIMIHRALLGSMERFIAVLIEHYAGAFPLWLAPVQARVLTVSEKAEDYGNEVVARMRDAGLRVEADLAADKLGAKIRRAQLEKIPYMLVVGEKDMAARVVSPRTREGQQLPATPLDDFVLRLVEEARPPAIGAPTKPVEEARPSAIGAPTKPVT